MWAIGILKGSPLPEYRLAPVFQRQVCACRRPCWLFEEAVTARAARLRGDAFGDLTEKVQDMLADRDRKARAAYLDHVLGLLAARRIVDVLLDEAA